MVDTEIIEPLVKIINFVRATNGPMHITIYQTWEKFKEQNNIKEPDWDGFIMEVSAVFKGIVQKGISYAGYHFNFIDLDNWDK